MTDYSGKRIVVIGAARQGLALARYLARHGAAVVLNDKRSADEMMKARDALADVNVAWSLGDHPLPLLDKTDLLCISGGVPLNNPLVLEAARRNIPLTNDTQIFMEVVPCRTLGITGSAGKTTTTTLVGRMANADETKKYTRIWVGGNIGDPLLNYVDEMQVTDLAILEISSFQLEQMTLSPQIAAITNITPNHLDRHGTMEAYIAAKARILQFQSSADAAVLCRDDAGAYGLRTRVKGHLLTYGFSDFPTGTDGAYIQNDKFFLRSNGETLRVPVEDHIELRGEHNRLNVLGACTIAFAAGFGPEAMVKGVEGFRGVAHRLEYVREWHGAAFYNDSIATAPERTMAAINAFGSPLVLMLGGRDKNLPWQDLAALVHQRVDHLVLFGEAAEKIEAAIGPQAQGRKPHNLVHVKNLQEAVQAAARFAQPGYVVLFSPGGTSFDEFRDFEERGEAFRKWVHALS